MTHQQKVDRLVAELGSLGIGRNTVAPPFFRMLWAVGLRVPPPLFLGYVPLALLMGGFFAFFWGLFMGLFQWQMWGRPPDLLLGLVSLGVGLFFGLTMAVVGRRKAAQLGLPSWESYGVCDQPHRAES